MPSVIAEITPDGGLGPFPVVRDKYLRGSLRVVADLTERDAITAERRSEGMEVNLANGTKYKLIGGILNANWQLVVGGASASCTATVDPLGVDDTASIGGTAYATLAEALADVIAAAPSAANPLSITLCAGNHTVSASLALTLPYVTITGAGSLATTINFTGSSRLTIAAANITLDRLTLQRSGNDPGPVLTCNVTSLATWLDNIRCNDLRVINLSGTAIRTMAATGVGIHTKGKIACEYLYGGEAFASLFEIPEGQTPGDKTYAIRFMQTCMATGAPVNSGYNMHVASLQACKIRATNPDSGGINAITEMEIGMIHVVTINFGTDLISSVNELTGAPEPHGLAAGNTVRFDTTGALPPELAVDTTVFVSTAGLTGTALKVAATLADANAGLSLNLSTAGTGIHRVINHKFDWVVNGSPTVSFYPSLAYDCIIYGPETGGRAAGVGYGIRGTLRGNPEVYGDNCWSYLNNCEVSGAKAICPTTPNTKLLSHIDHVKGVGCTFVAADDDVFEELTACSFTAADLQNDSTYQLKGQQYQFHGSTDNQAISGTIWAGVFGRESRYPMMLRLLGSSSAVSCDEDRAQATTAAYKLATMTVECWFRCEDTTGNSYLLCNQESGSRGWFIACVPNNDQIYCVVDGVTVNVTGVTIGNTPNATLHHVAFTVTAGTLTFFLDGVHIGAQETGVSLELPDPPISELFRIGAGPGAITNFTGDITEVRISRVNRYPGTTTFEPAEHFVSDADTVDLYSDETRDQLMWTSQTRASNVVFLGGAVNPANWPFWVRRGQGFPR